MPKSASPKNAQPIESTTSITNVSGGVSIDADRVKIAGDVVGHDKITNVGYGIEQVQILLAQIASTFTPKPFDGRSPYLGLDYFSEDDADRFFGREALIDELTARVKTSRYVVVAGPSGSGKSSLVRAGLIAALKQGALPKSDRWLYATLTPGRDPIDQLALAMGRLAKSPDAADYIRAHAKQIDALHKLIETQLSDDPDQRAVIFVDQFEEVFTQVAKEDQRQAFIDLLTEAATLDHGRTTVLFAMRSDFVSNCAVYPHLNSLIGQQFLQVGPMQSAELVNAIARPALQVGLRIDPDLVAQIVNDMQAEPGALPLMQFALKDLFDAQQATGGLIALTLNDYLARGGLRKSLERHADAAFAKLNREEQDVASSIFSRLIEIGRGTVDTRRTALFDELVSTGVNADQVNGVVQKLAAARLITTDEQGSHDTVTIAHEKLIEAWPWLKQLIDQNREAIVLQNQIAEDAKDWNDHQRDASYLYTGARLATAREQLATKKIALSGLAQAFIEVGSKAYADDLEAAKRRAAQLRQRAIYLIAALVVAALLGIMAGAFGIQANQTASSNAKLAAQNASIASTAQAQAHIAFSRQLAAQALSHLGDRFDHALLLATTADQVENTAETRSSLLSTLQYNPHLEAFVRGHTDEVSSVAFSPDGKTLASASIREGTILLWDVSNSHTPTQLGTPLTGTGSIAFSPDGKTLALGSFDNTIVLWDVSNPRVPTKSGVQLSGYTERVNSLAFGPDGKTLASASADQPIILWDMSNPQAPTKLGEPLTGYTRTGSVAFSPDGKTLASSNCSRSESYSCIQGEIILWDVSNAQAPIQLGTPLAGHKGTVLSIAFSPDGKTLASASTDATIILWDISNLRTPRQLGAPITDTGMVQSVAFSPDGKTLASAGWDKTIRLWDVSNSKATVKLRLSLSGHTDQVNSVAFSPDGKTLASGSCDRRGNSNLCVRGQIILWDMRDSPIPNQLGTPLANPIGGLESAVGDVAFSPDGKTLASTSGTMISLWDVSNPQAPTQLGPPRIEGYGNIAFSPDGKMLASYDVKLIFLWDVSNPRAPIQLGTVSTGYTYGVNNVAFSPDGKTLASGSFDRMIILWDVSNPRTPTQLGAPLNGLSGMSFSPDGKMLASANSDTIILWDVSDPRTPTALGGSLSSRTGDSASMAFSPDGKTLASTSYNKTIILWDVSNLPALVQLGPPLSPATGGMAFSQDSKTLATSDGTAIILWDVSNPRAPMQLGAPLIGDTANVESVAFSPDGKTLASGSKDNTIILWGVDPISWQARACQIAGRNFTRTEWAQYMGDQPYQKTCVQWPLEP